MTAPLPHPVDPSVVPPGPDRALVRHDLAALLALGLVLGLACRGYYAIPYTDFLEFVDCGHAWLGGELPPTFKRGPVFPVLVVGLSKLLPGEAPEFHAAEWINAGLLPVNGLLVYLIGRRWLGAGARWAAAWVLLLPMGLYCTAHVIVEPLLTAGLLLTVALARRGSRWAYAAAAGATLVRYDAAGLIVGLALAELWQRRSLWRVGLGTALASLPLIIVLVLTGLTWAERSADHYLGRIATEPAFEPLATATLIAQTAFDPRLVRLPVWLAELEPASNAALYYVPLLLVPVGVAAGLRGREAGTVTAVVAVLAYGVVHTVFPVQVDRFGYPPAPLVVLLAGVGLRAAAGWLRRRRPPAAASAIVTATAGLVLLAALCHEALGIATAAAGAGRFADRVGLLSLVAIAAIWAAPWLSCRRLSAVVLLLAAGLLVTVQLGKASAKLGTGREMRNVVVAARWIRDHATATDRVLSSQPGLLRLFVGREPPDRFVAFADIAAESWPDILAECRQRRITYILWHDALHDVHGGYYADQMRLGRFDGLIDPRSAPGVQVERRFEGQPNVVIVRVRPE